MKNAHYDVQNLFDMCAFYPHSILKHVVVMMNQKRYESFDLKLVARHGSKTSLLPELELNALQASYKWYHEATGI